MGYWNRNNQPQFGNPAAPVVWGAQQQFGFAPSAPITYGGDPDYSIMGALFGAYEIMGDPQASPGAKMAAAGYAQMVLAGGGQVVGQKTPNRTYSQTLPCTSLAVAANAAETRDINLQPQRPFRPEKFRASSTHTAPFFVITAYSIGQDNQFVAPGSIPCDLFSEVALYSQIEAYTANLGNLITMSVQNIDVDIHDFRSAFFGTSLGQG
jgi:hypothetical protein